MTNLLDITFGIFIYMPAGWLFMILVILIECIAMSRILTPRWMNARIYWVTTLANGISGLTGIFLSLFMLGVRKVVVWFPWVGSKEVHLNQADSLHFFIMLYLLAFVLTILIELVMTIVFLRKYYPLKKIMIATVIANLLTYAGCSYLLYSFSFS